MDYMKFILEMVVLIMNNSRVKSITIDAMMLAILSIMTFTNIGFISIFGIAANTLIHIPVLIGAYLYGWKKGLLYGLFFGLLSMFKAMQSPVSILDPYFVNPLISVLPRAIFGLLAGLYYDSLKKLSDNKRPLKITLLYIGTFVLTIIHSVLTLGTLYLIEFSTLNQIAQDNGLSSFLVMIGMVLATNGLIEASLATLVSPNAGLVIERATKK